MYESVNICTKCWNGNYINDICSHCHHKRKTQEERSPDALPLMEVIQHRYYIGEVLGQGGFGITYSAWDDVKKRRVALKELFPTICVIRGTDRKSVQVADSKYQEFFAGMKKKFEDEANLMELLKDQCDIVKLYDLFHCNNTVYYAMEYLEGCDLNTYRKRHGLLTWEFLEPIMYKLLRTLKILHRQNLIHRDISPDNIFMTTERKICLIDFGSARAYQGNMNITVQKKDGFAPWEQYESNGKQGPWTDIYALSVTMYLLLTGKLVPKANDRIMRVKETIPLKTLCPNLPPTVERAITKGMSIKITDRFQSAEEYLQALQGSDAILKKDNIIKDDTKVISKDEKFQTIKKIYWLCGKKGIYAGKRKMLEKNREITVGRLDTNEITFPANINGVSRYQCVLFFTDHGELYVKDAGSSFGTFLNNVKIGREWIKIPAGSYLRFGMEEFQIICQTQAN